MEKDWSLEVSLYGMLHSSLETFCVEFVVVRRCEKRKRRDGKKYKDLNR